jgi:hypothetical protein
MMRFQCQKCLYVGDMAQFDPDNVNGPVTATLRCPRCGFSWQGTDQIPDFVVIKFREISGLQINGTLPRLPETTH